LGLFLGRECALIYKTPVLTGLSKGELQSLTDGQLDLSSVNPSGFLNAADEKNREGKTIPLRTDLAEGLRLWLAEKLPEMRAIALERGEPVPDRLPGILPVFKVPSAVLTILGRDLVAAGQARRVEGRDGKVRIEKREERGR
jgi:hypothetical protein